MNSVYYDLYINICMVHPVKHDIHLQQRKIIPFAPREGDVILLMCTDGGDYDGEEMELTLSGVCWSFDGSAFIATIEDNQVVDNLCAGGEDNTSEVVAWYKAYDFVELKNAGEIHAVKERA